MPAKVWSFGDRLIHADRPEWGIGQVTTVDSIVIEGQSSQRLTIRFERAGVKKIASLKANLKPAHDPSGAAHTPDPAAEPQASSLSDQEMVDRLIAIPEEATDPFRSAAHRLEASLGLYRFSDTGGSLLDWAAMQTRLADPLTRFRRHDLEAHFARFRRNLDTHTANLASELARVDKAAIKRLAASAPEEGQRALRRFLARR